MNLKPILFLKCTLGTLITFLFTASTGMAQTNYYVSPSGNDGNSGLSGFPKKTIQAAVNTAISGDIINVAAGTYDEDVIIIKSLSLRGAGFATTTVRGPIGGFGATMLVGASGVLIDGFTITRAGNNTTDWNDVGLNTVGIGIQGQGNYAEIRNSNLVGNRTGIDINNSNGNNIHDNVIDNNRTGMIFRNQTDNTLVQRNFIRNNWTVGILFLDGSGGTNSPVQSASGSTFSNNYISANWYGEVVDRQTGGSLPAPGSNPKNFSCNWYGSVSAPFTTTSNSTEPGYSAQIPVAYGGTATAPGGQPDIAGPASANIQYGTWLAYSTDAGTGTGFQPATGACTSCTTGNAIQNARTLNYYCKLQDAVNDPATLNGDTITVAAGVYDDEAVILKSLTLLGAGYANTTIVGTRSVFPSTLAGNASTLQIVQPGTVIDGFTITRETVNPATWNAAGVHAFGISIDGRAQLTANAEVRNCRFVGNRSAIDINHSSGNYIHDNIIDNNRSGLTFRNRTNNNTVEHNFITNNWTTGILFLEVFGGPPTLPPLAPPQAVNCKFNDNVINGNWYGDVVDRQSTATFPTPGTSNTKDFNCNWFGSASAPTISTNNSTEPTYAAQIPVFFGGTAVPPGGQPNILGPGSANILYTPWLTNGTDDSPADGFQPVPNSCNGNSIAPVITCPADATIACGESPHPSNTGWATAPTNCGSTVVTFADSPTPGCRCNYSFIRTWTATDACGNQSTCAQSITVSGPVLTCATNAIPSDTTYTGGVLTNLYLGYGPQSATLNVNTTSGSSFTYAWTGPTAYLSCTSCANPVFSPTAEGTYTFTVAITNEYGCSSSCAITFCVKDIRVPGHSNKVYLCHNANSNDVSTSAVPAHLGHGDQLGNCDQTCGALITARLISSGGPEEIRVYPNPNNGSFVVQLPDVEGQSTILVTDVQGKVITKKVITDVDERKINLNLGDVARGVYFIEVTSGDQHFRTKLLLQ